MNHKTNRPEYSQRFGRRRVGAKGESGNRSSQSSQNSGSSSSSSITSSNNKNSNNNTINSTDHINTNTSVIRFVLTHTYTHISIHRDKHILSPILGGYMTNDK